METGIRSIFTQRTSKVFLKSNIWFGYTQRHSENFGQNKHEDDILARENSMRKSWRHTENVPPDYANGIKKISPYFLLPTRRPYYLKENVPKPGDNHDDYE